MGDSMQLPVIVDDVTRLQVVGIDRCHCILLRTQRSFELMRTLES
jgi:hypothetical protein